MRTHGVGFKLLLLFILAYACGNLLVGAVFAQTGTATPGVGEEILTSPAADVNVGAAAVPTPQISSQVSNLDTLWVLIAGFLVFFMQAGFALTEAGFVGAKHVTNILMKNFFGLAIGAVGYWVIGFGLMFGAGSGFFGSNWFLLDGLPQVYPGLTIPGYAYFFFRFAFAATAATIASGAMAGRTEFKGYLICSLLVTTIIFPVVGHWIWGGGWLATLETPVLDFAGSAVVHATGGWIGLVGAIMLGPRRNRFGPEGMPMPGHSMTLAALGTFILWFGWFGFNPGSQLNADAASIALITVNTNLAAASGALAALVLGWYLGGKPQLPWGLNGALAGLVSVSAACDWVNPLEAAIVGAVGGIIMYVGVNTLETFEIDDVVGAVPVHAFCGVWGTLAVGLFHAQNGLLHGGGVDQLISQLVGIVAVTVFVLIAAGIMFGLLRVTVGLRVAPEAEDIGLDIYEHGMVAYPEFTNSPSEPVPTGRR